MVKVRMNTADVAAEVKCLRRLIGMRCSNVYDLSPKTYLLKLVHSSGVTDSGESEKSFLLMESGVRLHTTAYLRDKSNTPSGFTLKLRKHVRTRRLEDVRQLGYDRIILFQFGLGSNAYYIILELYAQGNIILADSDFTVMTLLRSHRDDDKGVAIMSRHRYPTEISRTFQRTTPAKLLSALTPSEESPDDGAAKEKQSGRAKPATLKVVLGEALGYGPALSEHIILDAGLNPNTKISKEDNNLDVGTIEVLAKAVEKFEDWLSDVVSGEAIPEGYILMQNKSSGSGAQMYDEFCPILLNQFKDRDHAKFETFDAALDEFYSKIESQRSEQQQKSKEVSAIQKLNKIRTDQENRVLTLKQEVDRSIKMAELIEYNLEDVDAAILAVRVALAKGMNWEDLARMVKEEKKSGNPVASLIDKLHLERNCMSLLLSNNLDEMDDDEKTLPVDKVEVDLALSAHANARRWYELKKKQEGKQEKTITAHEKAFKAAEKKTRLQLAQEKTVATISHMRKVHWFEKFNWFISSENYLVISGRDAQQNEMIVKRYMSKGDLYIHADLHGASTTVIKNHRPEQPVPPLTLNQAGCFTVCHSQAWGSKIVTSAWWVYPHQVSKTAPTGEYLTVGSFMIRGKKNFLPPHPLVMGFGLLFRLDESSLGLHLNERRVRGEEEGVNEVDGVGPQKEESDTESEADEQTEESTRGPNPPLSEANSSLAVPTTSAVEATNLDELFTEVSKRLNDVHMKTEPNVAGDAVASVTPQLEDLLDRALGIGSATTSGKKYNLETSQAEVEEEHDEEEKKPAVRDRPQISKAERRKLKKGQKNDIDANVKQEEEKQEESDRSSSSQFEKKGTDSKPASRKTPVSSSLLEKKLRDGKPGGGKNSRGQKGKLKKMTGKYADQDEEERSIRMALLAVLMMLLKCATNVKRLVICPGTVKRIQTMCHGVTGIELEVIMTFNWIKVLPRTIKLPWMRKIFEEEKEKLNDVDYLTGNPLPSDILLYAVPVCGPYSVLQSYKYRVKVIPGSAKKGKAAKTAMNLFSHMPEATQREKELMKACTDPELVAAIIGNVKITAAGLTRLKHKQKKSNKSNKSKS